MQAWTPERIQTLRTMVEDGLSSNQIAAKLRISRNSIMGAIHRNGISLKRPPAVMSAADRAAMPAALVIASARFWNPERQALMARMAKEGQSRLDVARALDTTEQAVRDAARRYKVRFQSKPYVPVVRVAKPSVWTPERLEQLRSVAEAGRSMRTASEEMGLSLGSIIGAAKHYGIRFTAPRGGYRAPPAPRAKRAPQPPKVVRRAPMVAPALAEQSLRPAWTRSSQDCCFPMWRHGERPGMSPKFCDAPVAAGRQYCGEHIALCFRKGGEA